MLSIFKKKKRSEINLGAIGTDMHSHLLPGIDDGSPDTDTSHMLIKGLQDLGYKQFITTPHILWDVHKNDATTINGAHATLMKSMQDAQLTVPIRPAAEYFLDDHFDELLEKDVPLLTIKDNLVLVEFSFISTPLNFKDKLFNLQIKGYKPILAHPERYLYFMGDKKWYEELKDAGCYFQLNILSLSGYYGKVPLELSNYLIKKQYIDFLGTDLHHVRHLEVLRSSPIIAEPLQELLDSGNILNSSL